MSDSCSQKNCTSQYVTQSELINTSSRMHFKKTHTLKFLIPRLLCTVVVSPSMLTERMQPLSLIVACFLTLSLKNSQTRQRIAVSERKNFLSNIHRHVLHEAIHITYEPSGHTSTYLKVVKGSCRNVVIKFLHHVPGTITNAY
jgi:hypothetical protein